jgi:hypothetical protein
MWFIIVVKAKAKEKFGHVVILSVQNILLMARQPLLGQGLLIVEASRSH